MCRHWRLSISLSVMQYRSEVLEINSCKRSWTKANQEQKIAINYISKATLPSTGSEAALSTPYIKLSLQEVHVEAKPVPLIALGKCSARRASEYSASLKLIQWLCSVAPLLLFPNWLALNCSNTKPCLLGFKCSHRITLWDWPRCVTNLRLFSVIVAQLTHTLICRMNLSKQFLTKKAGLGLH
mgnify:CR=1 FL=1